MVLYTTIFSPRHCYTLNRHFFFGRCTYLDVEGVDKTICNIKYIVLFGSGSVVSGLFIAAVGSLFGCMFVSCFGGKIFFDLGSLS